MKLEVGSEVLSKVVGHIQLPKEHGLDAYATEPLFLDSRHLIEVEVVD